MASELISHRKGIRQEMIDSRIQPYPQDGHKTHSNEEALRSVEGETVIVAGRISAIRGQGKIRFIDIVDESGKIQAVLQKDKVQTEFDLADVFDIGDFIRVTGERFQTRAGEPSVMAREFDMLSKSIRQLPNTYTGFTNEESRFRMPSVDWAVNPERRELMYKRSAIIQSVRDTLMNHLFLEVQTPILQPLYGGANAQPFTTHMNALDSDFYLRISPELYLKYYIMGGFTRVFEIARNFRNEGVDRTHNPEFTMMECYAQNLDYNDMMDLTELIYRDAAMKTHQGSPIVVYQGTSIDFSKPWRRLPMKQGILEYLNLDVDHMSDEQIQEAITRNGEHYEGDWVRGLGIAALFGAVEKELIQPTFVTDMPRETTSLCKPHREDPTLIERFEPYIKGMEIGNAYTELNDPILQRKFWEEERIDQPDAHPLDEDFIEAMEYGMPPTGGLGLGIDRMVMILTDETKLRNIIPFPTMKPIR